MVIAALSLTLRAPHYKQVVRSLRALSGPTGVEPGCLASRVFEDIEDRSRVLYVEVWESNEQLVTRLRSKGYRQVLAAMEESTASPQLQFFWVANVKGIEFLQATRLDASPPQPTPDSASG